MKLYFVLAILILTAIVIPASAETFKVAVYNPNNYTLTNYQVKINLSEYLNSASCLRIVSKNGNNLCFCYEQSSGECTIKPTDVVWVKIPRIPAKRDTIIYIKTTKRNYAVNGSRVFIFYDDFNENKLNKSKWTNVIERNQGHYALIHKNGTGYLKVWDNSQHCGISDVSLKSKVINLSKAVVVWRIKVLQVRSGNPSFGVIRSDNKSIAIANSCSNRNWWNFKLIGSNWIFDKGHRLSYIQKWGRIVMKFKNNYASIYLVPEHYEINRSAEFPISAFRLLISGGSCCYGGGHPGHHVFGYDYVLVRKYADLEPTVTIKKEQLPGFEFYAAIFAIALVAVFRKLKW